MRRKYLKFLEIVNGKQSERIKRKQQEPISAFCNLFKLSKPGLRAVRGDDQAGVVPEWEENSMEQSSF